jgi:hypothetical protein
MLGAIRLLFDVFILKIIEAGEERGDAAMED